MLWRGLIVLSLLLPGWTAPRAADAAEQAWNITGGTLTLSLAPARLADLGLSVADVRSTAQAPESRAVGLEPPLHAFALATGEGLQLRSAGGRLGGPEGPTEIRVRGGLALGARHPRTGAALAPAFLYDFTVTLDADGGRRFLHLRTADPRLPEPLEVHNAGVQLDREAGIVAVRMADVMISPAWADALGRPGLAGQWIGSLDLTLEAASVTVGETPVKPSPRSAQVLDVLLGELYGIASLGHNGTWPNGEAGLSAATTSCNNGTVDVPWNAPMAETHPFIGLAMFRKKDGVLEMIGNNWIKHGWFALANDQCQLGCVGGGGSYLAIGCSDTYSLSNNGSRFYLGPREEVNPWTGSWTACNSFFDAVPQDCNRDYFGVETDDVIHRLRVLDADLGNINGNATQASYYYEGVYYVTADDSLHNNIGWRECTMTWSGTNWNFSTVGLPVLAPNLGPVITTWGDQLDSVLVAPDDGQVILAVQTEDLGGGQWHYEYALYNRTSSRGVHAFTVPVGGATISNVGFHDIDGDPGTDWTATVADGLITWETDAYATDPNAPALTYQTMFNFRFDASVAPVAAQARGSIFAPGTGSTFFLDTKAPHAAAVAAPTTAGPRSAFALSTLEPNPFSGATVARFTLDRPRSVRLSVVDVSGRTIQVLVDGQAPAGTHSARWDGRARDGSQAVSGVYFFRLESGDEVMTRKAILLR